MAAATIQKRRPRRDWQSLVEAHANSGESVETFCKARGLSPTYFYTRRRELREQSVVTNNSTSEDFVSLPVVDNVLDVELLLGDGVVLRIRRG